MIVCTMPECQTTAGCVCSAKPVGKWWLDYEMVDLFTRGQLNAAVAAARDAALEEAAKIAYGWLESSFRSEVFAARSVGDLILELKAKP